MALFKILESIELFKLINVVITGLVKTSLKIVAMSGFETGLVKLG
jgi:hypothetical protein